MLVASLMSRYSLRMKESKIWKRVSYFFVLCRCLDSLSIISKQKWLQPVLREFLKMFSIDLCTFLLNFWLSIQFRIKSLKGKLLIRFKRGASAYGVNESEWTYLTDKRFKIVLKVKVNVMLFIDFFAQRKISIFLDISSRILSFYWVLSLIAINHIIMGYRFSYTELRFLFSRRGLMI